MALVAFNCAHCGCQTAKEAGLVNRARRLGAPLYCGKVCSGQARRISRTPEERKALKADYDRKRREELGEALLAEKRAAYHAAVAADPVGHRAKEREQRKRRSAQHVEYCQRPEYRKWKQKYDRQYRARKEFGDFGEAAIVLNDLIAEINSRTTRTEIYRQNGTLNKWIARRREYERQTDRR